MGMGEPPKVAKGAKTRKARKKLKRMIIEPSDNGGHVVTHEYERKGSDGPMEFGSREEEKHAFGTKEETGDHIMSHLGLAKKVAHMKGKTSANQKEKQAPKAEAEPEGTEEE